MHPCEEKKKKIVARTFLTLPHILAKIEFICQKILNIGILPGLLLIIKETDVSNIYCKIQDHTIKIFFKIVIFDIVGLHPPLHPLTLTAYPTPV